MADVNDDAKDGKDTSSEGEGSGDGSTSDSTGTAQADLVASYKKRQAGAEAARQAAETKAAALELELAGFRKANQTAAEKDLSELAATKARLEAAEKRADEAEVKANARILDAKFPNARKELPELTDEVKLAKFEAMLADGTTEPPTPMTHNESKTGVKAGDKSKLETAADVKARLLATPMPEGWQ